MNLRLLTTACLVAFAIAAAHAQSASLTANVTSVPRGGAVTLVAAVSYSGQPGAVGWSVTLPEGWSFVATSGPDIPQVAPKEGATGTLEWAFANVPAGGARFSFTVTAARATGEVQLPAQAILRVDGRQQVIEIEPIRVSIIQ